eukprot:GHVL01026169.1.p1 GENE.GHVL01026169.1~~GHVL01026169.1.p1  ORF type:complete len:144 (+),score=6.45 GHVL01026169.1:52-483(+)
MKYSLIFVLCLIYADASCTENDDKLLTTDWYPSFYSCFGDKNCIINTGLSEGCTDCWIGAVTCGAANCIAHCVGSNVSYCTKDCINCSKNNCDAQLKACTGLIKLPEPPTVAYLNVPDSVLKHHLRYTKTYTHNTYIYIYIYS